MTEPPGRRVKIVIEGIFEGNSVHLTVTCQPMLATHDVAEILEGTVGEIRAGRLNSINIRPIEGS